MNDERLSPFLRFCKGFLDGIRLGIYPLIRKLKPMIRNFIGWYKHFRTGHVMVTNLGRWESFCRAIDWTWRQR